MSESNWYYTQSDQRLGPVPLEQLQSLIAQGQVNPHDLAWTDGMEQWARVDHLPVLRVAAQSSAPVSVPVSAVIPVAARVEYASRVVALPPRAQAALQGHASPTGDIGDWPLDDVRVGQFERAIALRRKVTAAASLYRLLMLLSGISSGILLIVALVQFTGSSRTRSEALGFLIFTIISLGFTTLYFFVWRGTMRSQRWAPLTMLVLFVLGFVVNLIVMFAMMIQAPPGAVGAVFSLIIYGAFAVVSWRSFAAIPTYLAQPAWCQELLVKAKL